MAERISSINIKTSPSAYHPQQMVSMRGYVALPTDVVNSDSTLTALTGLEAPSLTVVGGEVSYGGSVYTGITTNDREIVMTIKPRGLSVNALKVRLNTLIAFSTANELVLEVDTMNDKGATSKLTTTGYITNVSAPIMGKDDLIVVTFRSPTPYLQRSYINVTSSHNLRAVNVAGKRAVYKLEPKTALDDSAATAPSPFELSLVVNKAHATNLSYFTITDSAGNSYRTAHNDSFPGIVALSGNGIIGSDTNRRVSFVGDTTDPILKADPFRLLMTVQPTWPMVFPSYTDLSLEVGFVNSLPTGVSPSIITLREFRIYPRVFGI